MNKCHFTQIILLHLLSIYYQSFENNDSDSIGVFEIPIETDIDSIGHPWNCPLLCSVHIYRVHSVALYWWGKGIFNVFFLGAFLKYSCSACDCSNFIFKSGHVFHRWDQAILIFILSFKSISTLNFLFWSLVPIGWSWVNTTQILLTEYVIIAIIKRTLKH